MCPPRCGDGRGCDSVVNVFCHWHGHRIVPLWTQRGVSRLSSMTTQREYCRSVEMSTGLGGAGRLTWRSNCRARPWVIAGSRPATVPYNACELQASSAMSRA